MNISEKITLMLFDKGFNLSPNNRTEKIINDASKLEKTSEEVLIAKQHGIANKLFILMHGEAEFTKDQNLRSSFNYVTLMSRKFNFLVPIDFSSKVSNLLSLLFNLNLSSCGFVADRKTLVELWERYEKFGPYCDWLVKKDLSHNYPWVFSTRCLSNYNDGVKSGYDLLQLALVREAVGIPVIASGGAGDCSHFADLFAKTGIDGALAASVFHSGQILIPDLKQYLANRQIEVRIQR